MYAMYGILTNIGPTHHPNAGKYTIDRAHGSMNVDISTLKTY